jgi:CBS domain-containing protein
MELLRMVQPSPEVAEETRVSDVVHMMGLLKLGAAAVTDGRKIRGIFTERDLMLRVVMRGRDPTTTRVGEVMTSPVKTVAATASVAEAASLMRDAHIRHLAVIDDDGDLLGLVAQRYLLYDLLDRLETKVDDLEGYIMTDGPGG